VAVALISRKNTTEGGGKKEYEKKGKGLSLRIEKEGSKWGFVREGEIKGEGGGEGRWPRRRQKQKDHCMSTGIRDGRGQKEHETLLMGEREN